MIHWDDRGQTRPEHALPLLLPDLFAVICTRSCLCSPFLLKECAGLDVLAAKTGEVVEVVFIPRLPNFLRTIVIIGTDGEAVGRVLLLPVSLGHEASAA